MRQKTFYFVILLLFVVGSLYFILGALITIPYIQKNGPINFAQNSSIDSTENVFLSSQRVNLSTYKVNPRTVNDKTLLLRKIKPLKYSIKLIDTAVQRIALYQAHASSFAKELNRRAELFDNLVPTVESEINANFIELKSMGYSYPIEAYNSQLRLWYPSFISNNIGMFTDAARKYEGFISELEHLADNALALLSKDSVLTSVELDTTAIARAEATLILPDNVDTTLDDVTIPRISSPGKDWGRLGESYTWLIQPHSVDLVLIFGMFGFGLFGASISMFVRSDSSIDGTPKPVPIGENVILTLVRGLSAAIVVFLTTKGGIALINNGTNDPNPYILFFSCLVGAVFSDSIWSWAKDKLFKGEQAAPAQPAQPGNQQAPAQVDQQQDADQNNSKQNGGG